MSYNREENVPFRYLDGREKALRGQSYKEEKRAFGFAVVALALCTGALTFNEAAKGSMAVSPSDQMTAKSLRLTAFTRDAQAAQEKALMQTQLQQAAFTPAELAQAATDARDVKLCMTKAAHPPLWEMQVKAGSAIEGVLAMERASHDLAKPEAEQSPHHAQNMRRIFALVATAPNDCKFSQPSAYKVSRFGGKMTDMYVR